MLISVNNLSKSFGDKVAVRGLSFDLKEGELVGFVGANGGGKTTSLRLLAGLMSYDSGEGERLGQSLSANLTGKADIGYMPQSLALYDLLSVRENLIFRAKAYHLQNIHATVDTAIETYGLGAFANAKAATLSGGWRRRLQLAASLIHNPSLILLDEPTAGLDASARQDVWRHIETMRGSGAGIVIATHDLADAERCDRIVFLIDGGMVFHGRVADLLGFVEAESWQWPGATAEDGKRLAAQSGVLDVYARDGGLRILLKTGHADPVLQKVGRDHLRSLPLSLQDATIALCRREDGNG